MRDRRRASHSVLDLHAAATMGTALAQSIADGATAPWHRQATTCGPNSLTRLTVWSRHPRLPRKDTPYE